MAVVEAKFEQRSLRQRIGRVMSITVAALANGDTSSNIDFSTHSDKTVQIAGTFGAGGSINVEGSNDGTNWMILTDMAGDAITMVAAGLVTIMENPLFVRANVTAGDENTDLTMVIVARG
jgi:CRISPR/Cas system CMR-associated protein Cmr3 (group 5 of RAMP superfamily)